MKTIIVNKGRSRQGKSKTIIKTAELLKQQYPNAIILFEESGDDDIKMMLSIDAIKIGIESKGDPNSRLKNSISEFTEQNCNIILCASRTNGSTVNAIREHRTQGYTITWVANARNNDYSEQQQNELNELSATYFLGIIKHLITQYRITHQY